MIPTLNPRCSFHITGPEGQEIIKAENFESSKSFTEGALNVLKSRFRLLETDASIFSAFCKMVGSDNMPNRLEYEVGFRSYTVHVDGDRNEVDNSSFDSVARNSTKLVSRIEHNVFSSEKKRTFDFSSVKGHPDPMLIAFFNAETLGKVSISEVYEDGRVDLYTYKLQ